jgi:hypothetical protein
MVSPVSGASAQTIHAHSRTHAEAGERQEQQFEHEGDGCRDDVQRQHERHGDERRAELATGLTRDIRPVRACASRMVIALPRGSGTGRGRLAWSASTTSRSG